MVSYNKTVTHVLKTVYNLPPAFLMIDANIP